MTQADDYSGVELSDIYHREELFAEKRINLILLPISGIVLLFSMVLPIINHSTYDNLNYIYNLIGSVILIGYQAGNFILLKLNKHSGITKYLTLSVAISIITFVLYGYHFENGFVHTTRSVTAVAYFLVIMLSGLYRSPKTCLFAGIECSLQYSVLYIAAAASGTRVYMRQETFMSPIVSFDVLLTILLFMSGAGFLMYINSKRQQKLMNELRNSALKANFFENYDQLTGLPNYKLFKERLNRQLITAEKRGRIFAVMCAGIDDFNSINQLHGHETGNMLLKKVGENLISTFREDDFVCRFMGDRFLVIFADLKSDLNVSDIIRKTKSAVAVPFRLPGIDIKLTAGAGICTFPNDADTADELITKAESAMHSAKLAGKNSYFLFNRENQNALEKRLRIEKELERAIVNNEFNLVYQPKVTGSGRIIGMECLIRWNSPVLGRVPPDVFIPIAERTGLIEPIGLEVFRSCCRQLAEWDGKGCKNVRTTVNVSSVQFSRSDFVDSLRTIIEETEVKTSWLGIEITESGIIKNEDECIRKLAELKNLGFSISIDDFGKGYSSLSRLGNYPLDTLKIDKAFVDGLPDSKVSVCLVRSIINLAGNLNYNVVAEGVETVEQINFLQQNGCNVFQGYYFYRPLPPEEIEPLLVKEYYGNITETAAISSDCQP